MARQKPRMLSVPNKSLPAWVTHVLRAPFFVLCRKKEDPGNTLQMDEYGWVIGAAALATASLSWAVRRWRQASSFPTYLVGQWSGAELRSELGDLEARQVHDVFVNDLKRNGEDPQPWLRKLPPRDSAHRVEVQALCSQLGLAFMYTWLVHQFAPWGYIPCHDSYTHDLEVTPDRIQHVLRYRLRRPTHPALSLPDPLTHLTWKVTLVVHLCPRRQALRHAQVLAIPDRSLS